MELTCGDCEFFDGEECQGKLEGSERYDGDIACDEIELICDVKEGEQNGNT